MSSIGTIFPGEFRMNKHDFVNIIRNKSYYKKSVSDLIILERESRRIAIWRNYSIRYLIRVCMYVIVIWHVYLRTSRVKTSHEIFNNVLWAFFSKNWEDRSNATVTKKGGGQVMRGNLRFLIIGVVFFQTLVLHVVQLPHNY